jgi:hypothetical protein
MLCSPALAHPFEEGHRAHFHTFRIADVGTSVHISGVDQDLIELESHDSAVEKGGLPSTSGASLMYAGYPYDPYA